MITNIEGKEKIEMSSNQSYSSYQKKKKKKKNIYIYICNISKRRTIIKYEREVLKMMDPWMHDGRCNLLRKNNPNIYREKERERERERERKREQPIKIHQIPDISNLQKN